MKKDILAKAANEARGLAMDAIHACSSGHLGLPLGAAEIGAVLFGESLNYYPSEPRWLNRDRFILSAGHGSMFLYSWLHLSGYDLSIDEVKSFRKLGSKTPGHPEFGETEGVECTTGPLGQGIGNAVGMALSSKMAAEKFNTADHKIIDNHVVCLAGDGCIQEGVAAESAAFGGHLGLDNLIIIYDSNDVTLDAMAEASQSEDTAQRFTAYGFDVVTINGHDLHAIDSALSTAKEVSNGKPKLIIAKTVIGKGIEQVAGTASAHGEGGAKFIDEARASIGLPKEHFYVSEDVSAYFSKKVKSSKTRHEAWLTLYSSWKKANPENADLLENGPTLSADKLIDVIPEFPAEGSVATRAAGGKVLNALASALPCLISGSADLHGSTKNYIENGGDVSRDNFGARNVLYGIREHAMGAVLNGIAYDGIFSASGATFATFSDYMRPSVRLAALSKLPVQYIWTHDSVAVGEDGPTHQPVETVASLRNIPNLDVFRPADAEETASAFASAMGRKDGPTGLILTRQNVPMIDALEKKAIRRGALKGGYVLLKESSDLSLIILASGSEVSVALAAAKNLGTGVRVISLPCMELFERQSSDYQAEVLPLDCEARIAIEAGVTSPWYKYVGLKGKVVGIDRFGISAPGDVVMEKLGISVANLTKEAKALI